MVKVRDKIKPSEIDELLRDAGYDEETNPAPVAVRKLAEMFISGGVGAVSAAREFLKVTQQSTTKRLRLRAGDICPQCGQVYFSKMEGVNDVLHELMDIIVEEINEREHKKEEDVEIDVKVNELSITEEQEVMQ